MKKLMFSKINKVSFKLDNVSFIPVEKKINNKSCQEVYCLFSVSLINQALFAEIIESALKWEN